MLFSIYYLFLFLNFSTASYTYNFAEMLTTSGTKSSPLTFQNIYERCTQYMKYFSLSSSLYLYPRDMHLEEISHLPEYHCNHSVYLRQWISISYIDFIFSNDMLKQLAVALCNQQNFLLCGCHC